MKWPLSILAIGALALVMGCDKSTSGGPGANMPPAEEPIIGQAPGTFSLDVPSISLSQGETQTVAVDIDRGEDFKGEVTLSIEPMPLGLTLTPPQPLIGAGVDKVDFVVNADPSAAVGDFTVNVVGHPNFGADAKSETKITVAKSEMEPTPAVVDDAQAQWDEFKVTMRTQLDEFNVKFEEMKTRAAEAQGDIKAELDQKVAEAKTKLDEAAAKLDEMQNVSSDQWEKVKKGVSAAMDDLKTIFE